VRFNNFSLKIVLITIFSITISFLVTNYTYSELGENKRKELRIAYANGYVAALQLNIEEIKILKKKRGLMKTSVMLAEDEYVKVIEELNK